MRRRDLLTQVLLVNLLLIVAAVVAAAIAANPDVSSIATTQARHSSSGFAVALTILFNIFLLQRRFRPLERLVDEMERADLSPARARTCACGSTPRGPEEVARLHRAFARMLERLEAERRRASSAALDAQEEERARVARDLHDEVNQSLTGLLLRLEALARRRRPSSPPSSPRSARSPTRRCRSCCRSRASCARRRSTTSASSAALAGHVARARRARARRGRLRGRGRPSGELPADVQLVVYRVAQEALSNAIRHSGAEHVGVRLGARGRHGRARVARRRPRLQPSTSRAGGLGIAGMRERALLVGGDLEIESRPERGHKGSARCADTRTVMIARRRQLRRCAS